ncbi:MAG: hypothetical protein R2726_10620 [Acidimicrobiales bacterium]
MQRRVARLVVVLLAGLLALPFVGVSPASAAPAAPSLTSPDDGATVDTNPVLEWSAVTDATKYRVQVATSLAFTTIVFDLTTFNTKATPSTDLAQTQLYWRAQAIDATNNTSSWSTVRSFTKVPPQAPVPVSPLTGDPALKFPNDPAVLRWQPLDGAKSYDVEIDDDPNFIPPLRVQTTTANTSYALTQPQPVGQNLYWRVRGRSQANLPTEFSQPQTFSFQWIPWEGLAPDQIILYPTFTPPATPTLPIIEEIVLKWAPTPGAVTYDLQASPNVDFTGSLSINVNVKSTQYSPPTTLLNGSYYWRVRPKNFSGYVADWSPISTFTRAWPATPPFFPAPPLPVDFDNVSLLAPADNSFAETEPTFTWTPSRLGDRYEIQFSTDANFSVNNTTCATNHTEFTPYSACFSNIAPAPTTYYWRVRPIDRPAGVIGLWSAKRAFQYLPNLIAQTGPPNGTTSSAPVLTWQVPADHIGKYRVTVKKASGSLVSSDTFNTAFVPQGFATSDCTPSCSWYVQTIGNNGTLGPIPNSATWKTFTLIDPPSPGANITLNPPTPNQSDHPPTLSWSPVTDAKTYKVWWAIQGSSVFALLNSSITTTAYAHTGDNLPTGTFSYYVEALDNSNQVIANSGIGSFSIAEIARSQPTSPANCPPATICDVNYDTPTLDWDRVPGATSYTLYLAADKNFTNIIATYSTMFTKLTPVESLKDSQAGQATYWYARPCYGTRCGIDPTGLTDTPNIWAFKKQARPIDLVSPANNAVVQDQITFDWKDFLQTNQDNTPAVTQEAKTYRLQVATTADFTQVIDDITVDQTTYTTFNKTYPEGDLWWRVQAIDGSDNPLTWSYEQPNVYRKMTKKAPPLTGLTPTANTQVAGLPLFEWDPQSFAARYEIEVYKNPDQPLSPTNRVFTVQTGEAAAAPTGNLPPGDYGWRLRRLDADNRAGQWYPDDDPNKAEELIKFSIVAGKAQLVSPTDGAQVPLGADSANTLLLDWNPVLGASQYRVEISTTAGCASPFKETKTTVMTAFAPEQTYPNTTYYWHVVSLDGANNTLSTSDCWSFTKGAPVTPGVKFTSLTPARILDSRPTGPQVGPYGTPWGAGTDRNVQVTGVGGVPGTAKAVTLNVTVTSTTAASFLSIYPNGTTRPLVSSLNWTAGQTIPNAVTVKVGASGQIRIYNPSGNVHVIVDVVGYYDDSGDGFTSLAPARILDSRPPPEKVGPYSTPWGPNTTRNVTVTSTGGVPANATAVVLNVTATSTTAASFLTIWPAGQTRPNASSLNWSAGQTIPNAVTVKVGASGQISVFNPSGNVNVIIDVVGYFASGAGKDFHPIDPARIQDSRPPPDQVGSSTPWGAGTQRDVQIANVGGVPQTAEGVLMNATVTSTTAPSFLTIWPAGQTKPTASSLNWSAGVTIANAVTAKVGNNQKVSVFNNSGNVHVLFDAAGWYG